MPHHRLEAYATTRYPMKIILFGTGPFAVPSFHSLIESPHEILAVVTRPIADAGARRKTAENPTRDLAEAHGLTVFDPPSCNDEWFVQTLHTFAADLFVVCDYGQILSRDCLAAARLGGINLHGSLLPKYRGAAPINWAIYHGEPELGVTIIHMTARLDGGPCLATASMPVTLEQTAADIEPLLAQLGIAPVHRAVEMLEQWDGESPIGEIQDQKRATKAPRLKKTDGQIDWSRSARESVNQIRAFQPWPGTYTHWNAEHLKQPLRMIVHRATAIDLSESESPNLEPGQVAICDKDRLMIQTGDGLLSINLVQPAGKRVMPIEEFLRGHRPSIGDRFD